MIILGKDNDKGGVAKTTNALHAAWYLAAAGLRVAFIDNDNNRGGTNAAINKSYDAHAKGKRHIYDVTCHPEQLLTGALQAWDESGQLLPRMAERLDPQQRVSSTPGTLMLVTGSRGLARAVKRFEPSREVPQVIGALSYVLHHPAVQAQFDCVIIDNAPSWDDITQGGMIACDLLIAPIEPSPMSLDGLEDYAKRVDEANKLRIDANIPGRTILAGAVISRYNSAIPTQGQMIKQIASTLAALQPPVATFDTIIPESEGPYLTPFTHRPCWLDMPDDAGSQALLRFGAEVLTLINRHTA